MARNDGFEYRETLGRPADGLAMLDYLAKRYRHSSRAEWASRVESGLVLLDERPVASDTVVRRGQRLAWRRPAWTEPDAPRGFAVLLEDAELLAVAKPAGLPTLPGAGFLETTLLRQVQAHAADATPLHRLGRWTSGVVLFARTAQARRELNAQWSSRSVGKRYRALASGSPAFGERTVREPIGPVSHPFLGTVHAAAPDGKPSTSRVTVLERRDDGFLCDVRIATGRPHQIRIHLAAAGHPLAGDPLYAAGGRPRDGCRALPGDPGYLLHAAELRFRHPRHGGEVVVECAPPPRLRRQR